MGVVGLVDTDGDGIGLRRRLDGGVDDTARIASVFVLRGEDEQTVTEFVHSFWIHEVPPFDMRIRCFVLSFIIKDSSEKRYGQNEWR